MNAAFRQALIAICLPAMLLCSVGLATAATSSDDFGKRATWQPPQTDDVRAATFDWLAQQSKGAELKPEAETIWPASEATPGVDLLERVVRIFALADSQAQELVTFCAEPHKSLAAPKFDWLNDQKQSAFFRSNLRLLLGRWLSQQRLYDEAEVQLSGLEPADVVDPASLLFYQSVSYHYLLNKEAGLKNLGRLMERQQELPKRYQTMARMMQGDLTALKDESLDHISRRMDDIKRRLDLGRTGKKVRGEEDGVIASLDKMIDQIEKQQQQQQQQQQSSSRNRSVRPADQSLPMQGKGPGEVANKNIGNRSGWGELPAKERDEALQPVGKEFPSHYRDIIEQYFRKLAAEDAEAK